jgi:ketose-bisphosphate aldolase
MLYSMKSLLLHAQEHKYAVGYFEAFNMDCMLAVLDAAEKVNSPVIIGFGGQFVSSPKRETEESIYNYGAVARGAAERSSVPVAVLLNEADHEDMIYQGMNAGFNAVMYQKAGEKPEETLRITREICRVAHMLGIDVESEVGELPCADISTGTKSAGSNTDIETAKRFVEETNIDALAVAIGNVHLLEGEKAQLDYELLKRLRAEISVPLVLHGGTGVSREAMRKAIELGISKVNVGTVMKRAYINAVGRFYTEKDVSRVDPHVTIGWGGSEDMISSGRKAISEVVLDYMDMFGSCDRTKGF